MKTIVFGSSGGRRVTVGHRLHLEQRDINPAPIDVASADATRSDLYPLREWPGAKDEFVSAEKRWDDLHRAFHFFVKTFFLPLEKTLLPGYLSRTATGTGSWWRQ